MIDLGDYGHPPSTRRRDYPLVQLQIALVWQLNFELRNFWHRELRELQGRLLDGLRAGIGHLHQLQPSETVNVPLVIKGSDPFGAADRADAGCCCGAA